MTNATKTTRGFEVDCIRCGESGSITLDLDDVETFHCSSCSGEFTTDDVRKILATWPKVLAWVETAPELGK